MGKTDGIYFKDINIDITTGGTVTAKGASSAITTTDDITISNAATISVDAQSGTAT